MLQKIHTIPTDVDVWQLIQPTQFSVTVKAVLFAIMNILKKWQRSQMKTHFCFCLTSVFCQNISVFKFRNTFAMWCKNLNIFADIVKILIFPQC